MYKTPKLSDKNKNVSFPTCQNISGGGYTDNKTLKGEKKMTKDEVWMWLFGIITVIAFSTLWIGFPPGSVIPDIGFVVFIFFGYKFYKRRKNVKEEREREKAEKEKEERKRKLYEWNLELERKEKEEKRKQEEEKAKIEAECAPYKEDAERGKVDAMRTLGKIYRKYYKWSDAKYWYKKAAERNDVEALFALINDYAIFGTSQAKERADQMASNPYASDEEKRRAVLMKVEIERYEYKQKEEAEEAARRRREEREAEQRRIEEIRTRAMMERNLAVTGDYFAVRPGESYCINEGDSCRFCARRTWASDEGWRPSSRCYL